MLSEAEEQQIIDVFNAKEAKDDFSVAVTYEDIIAKNYSLSAGQYFEVKIDYVDISHKVFTSKMKHFENSIEELFIESKKMDSEVLKSISSVGYED